MEFSFGFVNVSASFTHFQLGHGRPALSRTGDGAILELWDTSKNKSVIKSPCFMSSADECLAVWAPVTWPIIHISVCPGWLTFLKFAAKAEQGVWRMELNVKSDMQPVSIDVKCLNLWQNYNCNCHGCIQLFSYYIWGRLRNFFSCFPFLKCLYLNVYQLHLLLWVCFLLLKHTQMLLSMQFFYLIHALPRSERTQKWKTWRAKNKHIHVQSNVHHIFKHISKSSDFEIISQNKYIFFSQPIR